MNLNLGAERQWLEEKLRKLMVIEKRSMERRLFARNRRVSQSGIVYVLKKKENK